MRIAIATVALIPWLFSAGRAGEAGLPQQVKFSAPPKATAEEGKASVSFSVAAPTDVAVDVLGAGGKVVRHLGAAALGAKNDPPPPFKPGLAQSVAWDGKDDAGRPAAGGPFKFRVRLGLEARFDRFIGWEGAPPMDVATVNGLAVGPDRTVYVIAIDTAAPAAGRSENRIWAMSPEGRFLGTIYPYSARTDPAELRGADFLSSERNRLKPRVYDRVCPSYLPQMRAVNRQTMACTADGRLVFANGWGTELYSFGPRCILVMKTDGTIPRERVDGPNFGTDGRSGYSHLALSPDGKTAYLCGLNAGIYGKPENVLYRTDLGVKDEPRVIFGKLGQPGSGKEGLNDPRGIAVDAKGRVYVADSGNNRIAVLGAQGEYLGEIPLQCPGVISVHGKTGAVYAVSLVADGKYKLVRIGRFEDPKVAAELDLSAFRGVTKLNAQNYQPVMALDPHGEKPVVYLGSPSMFATYRLLRITDEGASLKPEKIEIKSSGKIRGLPYPQGTDGEGNFFFLDQDRPMPHGKVYQGWEVRADSGELRPWQNAQTYRGAWGKDGHFYRANWYTGKAVTRVDRSGKVVPFSATGQETEPYNEDRFSFVRANLFIPPSGDIWALYRLQKSPMLVSMLGPDGKIKRKEVVRGLQGAASLRLDSRGNIYVADGLTLDGQPYPQEIDAFAKRLREKGTTARGYHSEAAEDSYGEGYGSILKFGPEGGEIRKAPAAGAGETLLSAYPHKIKFVAKGLKGTYPRLSPMSPPRYDYPYSACWCLHAMFDVDGYDRLFVPDALQFCVRVLDAGFNEIATFGSYDQATEKGGKANAPGPEIPLEFPAYVHVGGEHVYVTDSASCARRIVRVALKYQVEESCPIP